ASCSGHTGVYTLSLRDALPIVEALGGLLARIDIRMQFAGEPAVRLLDVLLARVAVDPEYLVVVCQVRSSSPSSRVRYRATARTRSEEHTSELQSRENLVCRLLL